MFELLPYILFIFALGYVYTVPANDTDYPDELYIIELQDEKLDRDGAIACTGTQMWDKGADIASADPLIPGADGNLFHITGTTNFTAINAAQSQPGTVHCYVFDGILTMTHHATDLILPGAANITSAAGDRAIFIEESTDKWRCLVYQRADGTPIVGGGIANVVEDTTPQLGGELDCQAHSVGFTQQTVTYNGTTTTVDWKLGNKASMTFGAGNIGTFAFTNPTKPCNLLLKIIQDAIGGRTVTAWDADIKWVGGVAPTLSTGANAIDILSFYFDGTNFFGMASLAFA